MSVIVTLAEAKDYLRVTSNMVDVRIQALLDSAESWIAEKCGTAFTVEEREDLLEGGALTLRPMTQPVLSITEVIDVYAGRVIGSGEYRLAGGRIYSTGMSLVWEDGPQRYQVRYQAGYNDGNTQGEKPAGSRPAPLGFRAPVLMLVRRFYEARGTIRAASQGVAAEWSALADSEVMGLLSQLSLGEFC
jgi:hypothetical protein